MCIMLYMDTPEVLSPVTTATRGALRHEVMRRLLKSIFLGELPAGSRLMVMKLAERFGTSSTPVREALVELDAVGVVEFVHNRGVIVVPFGPDGLREIYHLRRILESEAARCACGRLDATALERLRQQLLELLQDGDGGTWSLTASEADRRLHALVAGSCGNARLAREIRRYDTLVQTIREIIGDDRQAQRQALREHVAVIDAMGQGDPHATARAMAEHIDSAARFAEAAMF